MNKQLEKSVGQLFRKEQYGVETIAELVGVRRSKVVLRAQDRSDSFTLPIEKFLKFYQPYHQDL